LYLYTAALTNQLPRKKYAWFLHFLPAALTIIYLIPFFLLSGEQKMDVLLNKGRDYKTFSLVENIVMQLSGIVYVAWSFILLRRHKKNIGQQFSYEERINLNWLRYLIIALLGIWLIIIFVKQDSFIFGGVVIYVTILGFFGIRQVGIFNSNLSLQKKMDGATLAMSFTEEITLKTENSTSFLASKVDENLMIESAFVEDDVDSSLISSSSDVERDIVANKRKKYANSGLTAEALKELHQRLVGLMATEKLYTEPELSLTSLAARLNIHPNYLSQTINEVEGKSFFDYINSLRVEEFKRLVAIPENSQFTIISLAYDCGFNSKSSFNKNFKKVTGQSPSAYLEKNN
jgi:AraC-like DNA-binding protein